VDLAKPRVTMGNGASTDGLWEPSIQFRRSDTGDGRGSNTASDGFDLARAGAMVRGASGGLLDVLWQYPYSDRLTQQQKLEILRHRHPLNGEKAAHSQLQRPPVDRFDGIPAHDGQHASAAGSAMASSSVRRMAMHVDHDVDDASSVSVLSMANNTTSEWMTRQRWHSGRSDGHDEDCGVGSAEGSRFSRSQGAAAGDADGSREGGGDQHDAVVEANDWRGTPPRVMDQDLQETSVGLQTRLVVESMRESRRRLVPVNSGQRRSSTGSSDMDVPSGGGIITRSHFSSVVELFDGRGAAAVAAATAAAGGGTRGGGGRPALVRVEWDQDGRLTLGGGGGAHSHGAHGARARSPGAHSPGACSPGARSPRARSAGAHSTGAHRSAAPSPLGGGSGGGGGGGSAPRGAADSSHDRRPVNHRGRCIAGIEFSDTFSSPPPLSPASFASAPVSPSASPASVLASSLPRIGDSTRLPSIRLSASAASPRQGNIVAEPEQRSALQQEQQRRQHARLMATLRGERWDLDGGDYDELPLPGVRTRIGQPLSAAATPASPTTTTRSSPTLPASRANGVASAVTAAVAAHHYFTSQGATPVGATRCVVCLTCPACGRGWFGCVQ
jgi:hypothetical protein